MRTFNVVVDGTKYLVEVDEIGGSGTNSISAAPQTVPVQPAPAPAAPAKAAAPVAGTKIVAPMPGTINKISAATGTQVKKGQAIVVLEAMKMENEIAASVDGTVTVMVKAGDMVVAGDVIAVIA